MKSFRRTLSGRFPVLILLSAALPVSLLGQGSLTPPGPPASSMKTLQQIEPRTPISSVPFAITAPGSYYATSNLFAPPGSYGITILTNDVSLDLNGFDLVGNGSVPGIVTSINVTNILIRHGTVRNWGFMALATYYAFNSRFENLRVADSTLGLVTGPNCHVVDCAFWKAGDSSNPALRVPDGCLINNCVIGGGSYPGILAGNANLIESCVVRSNAAGIIAGTNCTIRDCNVSGCGSDAFRVGDSAVLQNCQAANNGGYGFILGNYGLAESCLASSSSAGGIQAGTSVTLRDCNASRNNVGIYTGAAATLDNCQARANTSYGIQVGDNSAVRNCLGQANGNAGIYAGNNCRVQDSQASGNQSYGIWTSDSGQVINCLAAANSGRGFFVYGKTLVSGCVASQNTLSGIYVFLPGCQIIGNTCDYNNTGSAANEAGIFIDDRENRVDSNHLTGNTLGGIAINSIYHLNVITRNVVTGSGIYNYIVIPSNNDVGPIGSAATSTSPWANITE